MHLVSLFILTIKILTNRKIPFLRIIIRTHPQTMSWQKIRPSTGLNLKVINVLRGNVCTLTSGLRLPKEDGSIGTIGFNTQTTWTKALIKTKLNTIVSSHSPNLSHRHDQGPTRQIRSFISLINYYRDIWNNNVAVLSNLRYHLT